MSTAQARRTRAPAGHIPASLEARIDVADGDAHTALLPRERGMLEFRLAQRIAAGALDEARTFLLLNIVETYLDLNEAEQATYESLLVTKGGAEVAMLELTWADRKVLEGREQGQVEGQRAVLRRVALARFGTVPEQLEQHIASAQGKAVESLLDRLLQARDVDELLETI